MFRYNNIAYENDLSKVSLTCLHLSQEVQVVEQDKMEDSLREARTSGWKPVAGTAVGDSSSIVVFHGGFSCGLPRYTLTLLERGYELFDKERDVLALMRRLPTPEQAARLLNEHGVATSEALDLEMPDMLFVPEEDEPA